MENSSLESLIVYANSGGALDEKYTLYLDQVRNASNRWSIGLDLFFSSNIAIAKFFALSLVRDYLVSCNTNDINSESIQIIKDSVLNFLMNIFKVSNENLDKFIINNLVSIVTLCIKIDYPEKWPSAFNDLLLFQDSSKGIEFIINVLFEFDIEVVEYKLERSQKEMAHNTVIKDRMRDDGVVEKLVDFLCLSAITTRQYMLMDLSCKSLKTLSKLIVWIDISLTINKALPTIYQCLNDSYIGGSAVSCIFELIKKGMDPFAKVKLLISIELIQVILSLNIEGSMKEDSNNPSNKSDLLNELGFVIDILVQELLGVWISSEDQMIKSINSYISMHPSYGAEDIMTIAKSTLTDISLSSAEMLLALKMPLLVIFNNKDTEISSSVIDSINKIIAFAKTQMNYTDKLEIVKKVFPNIFIAKELIPEILINIYQQMQYPSDFCFDTEDEDEAIEIEHKKLIRKLFVNICRIYPDQCFQLINSISSSFNQPIATVPFAPLEALLRLIISFSDSGPGHAQMVNNGTFSNLLISLYQSDISQHFHVQVLLAYFEICARYSKIVKEDSIICKVADDLLGNQGLRYKNTQVRYRAAYLFLRFVEGLDNKAVVLMSLIQYILDLLLKNISYSSSLNLGSEFLNEQSELYLFEALGLITSSSISSNNPEYLQLKLTQENFIEKVISHIILEMKAISSNTSHFQQESEFSSYLSHKINSIASIAKGHNHKNRKEIIALFKPAAEEIANLINIFPMNSSIRGKTVIFMHRMITTLGNHILQPFRTCFQSLILNSDAKDTDIVIQLVNQFLIEFTDQMLDLIDLVLRNIYEKYKALYINLEKNLFSFNNEVSISVSPQFDLERSLIIKQFLVFIYHIVHYGCQSALSISHYDNYNLIESFLEILIYSLKGEISPQFSTYTSELGLTVSIPLRKLAVSIFIDLTKEWSEGVSGVGPNSISRGVVPVSLSKAFANLLYEKILPICLAMCTKIDKNKFQLKSPELDFKDPLTLSLLQEIGALIWTMANIQGSHEVCMHINQLLTNDPRFEKNYDLGEKLIQSVTHLGPIGNFRDNFKKLIKSFN